MKTFKDYLEEKGRCWPGHKPVPGKKPFSPGSCTKEELELQEDLRKWFAQKWVRMDTKGNIKGDCAREPGEGKPKCLPQSKAQSLGKEGRASAARRKRREDPNPERRGAPINVATEEVEQIDEKNVPTSPEKWARAKSAAKSKFAVYPSAYANAWASKKYKSMGGGWRATSEEVMSAAPANAVGTGNIAGSGGAGGEPGVSKKRNPLMSFYKRKPPKM
jgi:hypothetical protein